MDKESRGDKGPAKGAHAVQGEQNAGIEALAQHPSVTMVWAVQATLEAVNSSGPSRLQAHFEVGTRHIGKESLGDKGSAKGAYAVQCDQSPGIEAIAQHRSLTMVGAVQARLEGVNSFGPPRLQAHLEVGTRHMDKESGGNKGPAKGTCALQCGGVSATQATALCHLVMGPTNYDG